MKKVIKLLKIIIPIIIVAVIVIVVAIMVINKRNLEKTIMNTNYVNGNSGGNLYNAGLFCEFNDTIYFANPSDGNKLYKMSSDLTKAQKINDDCVMYINVDGNYIYYVRNNTSSNNDYSFFSYNNNSLCRIRKDGKGDTLILDEKPCIYASLLGNYIYYLHYDTESATTLYKVRIDGEEKQQVLPTYIFTCASKEDAFYYNNTDEQGKLYKFNTGTDTSDLYYNCNCYKPLVDKSGRIFYMNVNKNYSLSMTTADTKAKTIINDRVDCYNVSKNMVFYQKNDSKKPGLCYKNLNKDEDPVQVKVGIFTNINITSNYVFFFDYSTKQAYYAPINAPERINPLEIKAGA